jgi:hypothetical protein
MPTAIMATPMRMRTGVSSARPVNASPDEPLPVFPVDEGLLTTAATGDVVVVVTPALVDGTVVVVVDVVDEVDVHGTVVVVVVDVEEPPLPVFSVFPEDNEGLLTAAAGVVEVVVAPALVEGVVVDVVVEVVDVVVEVVDVVVEVVDVVVGVDVQDGTVVVVVVVESA